MLNSTEASFKASARTLDMLGRQQIAGIPTAISELFKNAHDADADIVEVDYYRSEKLLVIRDDGFGMELEEFQEKWLTIATETSIIRKISKDHAPRESTISSRPVLGEKGIGRLAIATIAPQVLILTRAKRNNELSDLTAAFLNWQFFECPGLRLQDIRIPLRTFPGGSLPSNGEIAEMVADFRDMNVHLKKKLPEEKWHHIETTLKNFNVSPIELSSRLGEPSLLNQGHGTHFYLLPSDENLDYDIDENHDPDRATPIQEALLGFTTPLFANTNNPVIQTAFRVHHLDGQYRDLIDSAEFFTNEEYENADHRIWGKFDDKGQFRGHVSVYGEITENHVINWSGGKGKKTACGPFRIKFAAIEGATRYSTLPPTDHAYMLAKTRKIGGLYIYRDGVRIQPYGNTDYDWLEIELRRTKSASFYYFSYRQMFGLVEVDSIENPSLREKAGREGFRENLAYRHLRDILKNFLVQIAADFFRVKGIYADRFTLRKQELDKIERHRKARKKKVRAKQKKFEGELHGFFEKIQQEKPRESAMNLMIEVEQQVRLAANDKDQERAVMRVLEIERSARTSLMELERDHQITKPRIGISKRLAREWGDYQEAFEDLRREIDDARDTIESTITIELKKIGVDLTARERLESVLEDTAKKVRQETRGKRRDIERTVEKISDTIRILIREYVQDLETTVRDVTTQFNHRNFLDIDEQQLVVERSSLEKQIQEAGRNALRKLEYIQMQLEVINLRGDTSIVDELVAIEESNIALKEQATLDLHLAQLGMAIEIISHEFGAAIRAVRYGLKGLKPWADLNSELLPLYQNIRYGFEHLDGYLSLFTPLQSRLYRTAVTIRGGEIFDFLMRLFGQRMSRHHIKFMQTDSFANIEVRGYPSSFYPVFINLIDNAIFWLSGLNERNERKIQLDASRTLIRVSDSGPGIHDRDKNDIFDLGFTKKPEGRGMGLYIAKKTLHEIGYDLTLEDHFKEFNTTFLIKPIKDQKKAGNADE